MSVDGGAADLQRALRRKIVYFHHIRKKLFRIGNLILLVNVT